MVGVIAAFTRSSDALISRVVFLSQNLKTWTLTLLHRCVGFVLSELSDSHSREFSQEDNNKEYFFQLNSIH